jgi:hypothetical protein
MSDTGISVAVSQCRALCFERLLRDVKTRAELLALILQVPPLLPRERDRVRAAVVRVAAVVVDDE